MADLRKLKDRAASLAGKGRFAKAAEAYRQILRADSRDASARQKLAEVLRKQGDADGAVAQYRLVADGYGRDGLLAKAIAVCKVILEIDPRHRDTQRVLADLYARRQAGPASASGIRGAVPRIPPLARETPPVGEAPDAGEERVELPLAPAPPPPAAEERIPPPAAAAIRGELPAAEDRSTAFEIILEAARAARQDGVEEEEAPPAGEPQPAATLAAAGGPGLPRFPLFSDLDGAAFQALAERITLRRLAPGETVLQQGDEGDRFYLVAAGRFRVERRDDAGATVILALLEEGAFFGEMALLSGAPRAASVVAEVAGELLELRAEVLAELCRRHPHVADSLKRFCRQRLLANVMATSPLFRPFGREERRALMERFRVREVAARETVVQEGHPSDGLYVVLCGALDVLKRKGGAQVPAGGLREGDVFGEMSCLGKTPASATVVARRAGTLLRLPRACFDELVVTHPQILELVSELADERKLRLEAVLDGSAAWTDEGLVLV